MLNNTTKPNILWICTDQQRWDTLGCYGNPWVNTPNLDALSKSGVRFNYAYSQSPVCTPSRASFLTGRYPRTTRCRQNGQEIPSDEKLVTSILADNGYNCGLSGKLHLSPCHPSVCKTVERRINDGYAVFDWSHHHGAEKAGGLDWADDAYSLWLREKGLEDHHEPYADSKYVYTSMPEEYHQTTWCAQKAINFIESNAEHDMPWLFSVNMFDPHHAFDPPKEYLERYLNILEDIPLPSYGEGELENKPYFQGIDHRGAYSKEGHFAYTDMSDEDHRLIRAAYWAMVDLIDKQVGRMVEALERTGQLENTLIIFMSDHGEMLGDHGIYLKGAYFYEEAIHVPLLMSWKGKVRAGIESNALAELVDIAPTILDAAGLPPYPGMQGKSLWGLLTGETEADSHRKDVYCECYNAMRHREDINAFLTMVRTEQYKLVCSHGKEPGELYDLKEDPAERCNLWDKAEYCEIKCKLLKLLCDRMAETVDPLPVRKAVF
ncbi:MAG: sulfatase-like hydrolase/transferase [Firmicutes bacterium]|nr:sulfatase-like hydrolase/transferase [Bacillota bacterium]